MLRIDLLQTVKDFFNSYTGVLAVYLFGSTVKGKERPGSDLDLAVLFDAQLNKYTRFEAKLTIVNDLEDLTGKRIDIVDLRSADSFFVHKIMQRKILLVDKNTHERVHFEVKCRKDFFDRQRFLRIYQRQALKRLKERF